MSSRHSQRRDVRWGLVFVAVLVGTVGLSHAIGWYFDPMREIDAAAARIAAARPPARPARGQPVPSLPQATREELALLTMSDVDLQVKGAETLLARKITPELVLAVEAALRSQPDERLERLLVCVKSRFDGEETLAFMLARFPKEAGDLDSRLTADVACMLDALAERIADAPARISAALMPAAFARSPSTRHKVLAAFRTIDLPFVPSSISAEARVASSPRRNEALAAAVALGAIRREPEIVAAAVRDPKTSAAVREDLRADPHPNAARIVAHVWAEHPFDAGYAELARAREGVHHDVSAALVEIVRSLSEPERKRVAAAGQLGTLSEVGAMDELRELSGTLPAGELRTTIDATLRTLQERRTAGIRDRMRTLPQ